MGRFFHFYVFTLNFGQLTLLGLADPDLMLNVTAAPARISLNKTEAEYQFERSDFYPSIALALTTHIPPLGQQFLTILVIACLKFLQTILLDCTVHQGHWEIFLTVDLSFP